MLGKIPKNLALSGKFANKFFTKKGKYQKINEFRFRSLKQLLL